MTLDHVDKCSPFVTEYEIFCSEHSPFRQIFVHFHIFDSIPKKGLDKRTKKPLSWERCLLKLYTMSPADRFRIALRFFTVAAIAVCI